MPCHAMNCIALNIFFFLGQTDLNVIFPTFHFSYELPCRRPVMYSKCTFHGLTVIANLLDGPKHFKNLSHLHHAWAFKTLNLNFYSSLCLRLSLGIWLYSMWWLLNWWASSWSFFVNYKRWQFKYSTRANSQPHLSGDDATGIWFRKVYT